MPPARLLLRQPAMDAPTSPHASAFDERPRPVFAISPHLDDAVLGCGAVLASRPGAVVVTALAGGPASWESVTPWDAECGFSAGDDVIAARRAEDREALSHLGATPVWLDFLDAQYGPSPGVADLATALTGALDAAEPDLLLFPLGLYHADHALVAQAVIPILAARPHLEACAYEEPTYRTIPGVVEQALTRLEQRGFRTSAAHFDLPPECHERKRRAVHAYRSQLVGLTTPGRPGLDEAFERERLWRILR